MLPTYSNTNSDSAATRPVRSPQLTSRVAVTGDVGGDAIVRRLYTAPPEHRRRATAREQGPAGSPSSSRRPSSATTAPAPASAQPPPRLRPRLPAGSHAG